MISLRACRCVLDLGAMPPANCLLEPSDDGAAESRFPLRVMLNEDYWFLQLAEPVDSAVHFNRSYPYFSSTSHTAVDHARRLAEELHLRFLRALDHPSRVLEVGSNDGYLLQFFLAQGAVVLGIEPSESVAAVARAKGIESLTEFYNLATAQRIVETRGRFDLLVANNVIAHTPDLPGMFAGLREALAPGGVVSVEVASLYNLVESALIDTVYHEHYSYFSVYALVKLFAAVGLEVFDVAMLDTHGGSIRVLAGEPSSHPIQPAVPEALARETARGVTEPGFYAHLQKAAEHRRRDIRDFFTQLRTAGRRVIGYGAPAKASTLLNFCGLGVEHMPCIADASPGKHGRRLPGVHIPIVHPDSIDYSACDDVVILPWNIQTEIVQLLAPRLRPDARCWVLMPSIRQLR